MPFKAEDLSNQKFGRLTAIRHAGKLGRKYLWMCVCDCGNAHEALTTNLKSGKVRSCGCLQKEEQSARITLSNTVHGHNKSGSGNQSPTWNSWNSMKKRCLYKKHISYPSYGGRGIKICDEWIASFEKFLHDMGERPNGKTLDRIDVNGNYEPKNCRWATASEQQKNKRGSR